MPRRSRYTVLYASPSQDSAIDTSAAWGAVLLGSTESSYERGCVQWTLHAVLLGSTASTGKMRCTRFEGDAAACRPATYRPPTAPRSHRPLAETIVSCRRHPIGDSERIYVRTVPDIPVRPLPFLATVATRRSHTTCFSGHALWDAVLLGGTESS